MIEVNARIPPIIYKYHENKFNLGNATSLAPINIGRKKLPNIAGIPGIIKRKIIITPWSVKKLL
jgi:hypothetical protein